MFILELKLYNGASNCGGRKRGVGKNGSTHEENDDPDRKSTIALFASRSYTDGIVSHQALQLTNSVLLTYGT